MACQYHSAYASLPGRTGAYEGTEYTPQWMKMPNLASENHAGVVFGRQVWHLHPLGRVLGPFVCAGPAGQAGVRGMVLARHYGGKEAQGESGGRGFLGVSQAGVRPRLLLPGSGAAVPRRIVRPGSLRSEEH